MTWGLLQTSKIMEAPVARIALRNLDKRKQKWKFFIFISLGGF